ncbi:MAG: DUF3604 domain-containing protein [Clostridia bacterium]|nr:DUF3604 domain-containing protein [Clostridia bacterium]
MVIKMGHPDKYIAKRYDTPNRLKEFTDTVYRNDGEGTRAEVWAKLKSVQRSLDPPPPELIPLVGEMHGHTRLSDGAPDVDAYFSSIRDLAKLDFAVLTDHDHGGVATQTLWAGTPSKWDLIRQKAVDHRVKGKFSTLLGYERDSYPFYNNLVLYFRDCNAELFRGVRDGELTAAELRELLAREDVIICPHDTYSLTSNADFLALPQELIAPFIEVISRGDAAEYMGNPAGAENACCEGGFWQDALRRGAKMGVIGGSDDHEGMNGRVNEALPYPQKYPGVTGVWATENSPEAIFEALRAKRTYAFMMGSPDGSMGGRMEIDFRINGHYMGETFLRPERRDLHIFYKVKADTPVKRVTLVKNCRNYISLKRDSELILDYKQENPTDHYYLRVELSDGRFGWTSPVWVEDK